MIGSTYIDIGWDEDDKLNNNVVNRLADAITKTPSESSWLSTVNAMIEYLRTTDPDAYFDDQQISEKFRDAMVGALGGTVTPNPNIITTELGDPITTELGVPITRDI